LISKLDFKLGTVLDRRRRTVLDIKVGSKLGTVLDREPSPVVVHDIKYDFTLGTVLDRKLCTVFNLKRGSALDNEVKFLAKVIQVIKNIIDSFGAEIGSALVAKLGSILGIALGLELGTALGSELGTAKSKMHISVPTGNQRLIKDCGKKKI
jgi:hypothetical protein